MHVCEKPACEKCNAARPGRGRATAGAAGRHRSPVVTGVVAFLMNSALIDLKERIAAAGSIDFGLSVHLVLMVVSLLTALLFSEATSR